MTQAIPTGFPGSTALLATSSLSSSLRSRKKQFLSFEAAWVVVLGDSGPRAGHSGALGGGACPVLLLSIPLRCPAPSAHLRFRQ